MTEVPRLELVAAVLRRDLDDVDLYAHFLQNMLAEALPPELVRIERRPSLADRLAKRPGPVARLSVLLGDRSYVLYPRRGAPRAEVVHVVKGMELDHAEVGLDTWIEQLAAALTRHASTNARAAQVLARVTDPGRSLD